MREREKRADQNDDVYKVQQATNEIREKRMLEQRESGRVRRTASSINSQDLNIARRKKYAKEKRDIRVVHSRKIGTEQNMSQEYGRESVKYIVINK